MRCRRPGSRKIAVQTHLRRGCRPCKIQFAGTQVNAGVLKCHGGILVGSAAENQCIQFHSGVSGQFQIQYGESMMESKVHRIIGFGDILHGSPDEVIFSKMRCRAA